MKAFHFHLDQALRWRATQVQLEKTRLSVAAGQLRQIREEIATREREVSAGSMQLSAAPQTGEALTHWASFMDRSRRQLTDLNSRAAQAEKALATQAQCLLEANRRMRLLDNLKQRQLSGWRADLNRELEAFAAESHLVRLQLNNGRARSSGG